MASPPGCFSDKPGFITDCWNLEVDKRAGLTLLSRDMLPPLSSLSPLPLLELGPRVFVYIPVLCQGIVAGCGFSCSCCYIFLKHTLVRFKRGRFSRCAFPCSASFVHLFLISNFFGFVFYTSPHFVFLLLLPSLFVFFPYLSLSSLLPPASRYLSFLSLS